tara:strand:- start:953 stop:1228 length:276 start_codon:yes stop_codon:yes gene_type:complete
MRTDEIYSTFDFNVVWSDGQPAPGVLLDGEIFDKRACSYEDMMDFAIRLIEKYREEPDCRGIEIYTTKDGKDSIVFFVNWQTDQAHKIENT